MEMAADAQDTPKAKSTADTVPLEIGSEPLPQDFYDRPVLEVARDLIGCVVTLRQCSGIIVETEAYHDSEPACHAYVGLTARTATLFGSPGRAYVYRSYGIHALFNAVCESEGSGAAVLIRALEPLTGIELMQQRRGSKQIQQLCSGPGKLTQALEIEMNHNDGDLTQGPLTIHAHQTDRAWIADKRIGITKAAELPWRFCASGSKYVSRPWPPPLHVTP
jgi:DNA-3-methyladenine glycosylase